MVNTTFSKEEKAAMRAAAAEAKAAKLGADLEAACLAAIDEMTGTDKELAETLHELVKKHTSLGAKTWYGMPAYANARGQGRGVLPERRQVQGALRHHRLPAGRQPGRRQFLADLLRRDQADADDQKQLVDLLKKAVSEA